MRLFCVKMRRRDWFRMGHSDWLLGRVVSALSVSCNPVLTRLRSRDCDNGDCLVPKIEIPLCGWIEFSVMIKWLITVMVLRFWIKTGLLFLLWQCWGGGGGGGGGDIRDAPCIGNVYPFYAVAVLFKHQWWAPCGPQLDCTRVINIQMMCTVAYLGIPVLLFPGSGLSKGFRFLVAWVRLLLERRFGCVSMVPKDHLEGRLPAGSISPVRWGAQWWRARFSLSRCGSLYDSESTYVVVQGDSIFNGMLTLAKVLRGGEVCYCQFDHLCSSVCDRLLYGLSNPTQSRSKLVEWGVCESVWLLP